MSDQISHLELDVEFCRGHFPNLSNGWVYMENAGGSYVPQSLIDRTVDYLSKGRTQPYDHYESGAVCKAGLDTGEEGLAAMLGVKREQLVIGANTTVNFYVLAQGLRGKMAEGDEIIVTNQDHEANIGCWRRLSESGIVLREWQVNADTGLLRVDDLKTLISPRTKLVCLTHASNVVAAINDIKSIAKIVHDAGALVCVDGVAYCPHAKLELVDWGVDFYGISLYKMLGPHLGVLYCKEGLTDYFTNQNHFFLEGRMPAMLNPGGRLYCSVACIAGVTDYIKSVYDKHFDAGTEVSPHEQYCKVFDLFGRHEEALATKLIDCLKSLPKVRLLGPATGSRTVRKATIAFVIDGMKSKDVMKAMSAKSKISIAASHFYSYRLVESLGIDTADGVVRVAMLHYNTLAEVQLLCDTLQSLVC